MGEKWRRMDTWSLGDPREGASERKGEEGGSKREGEEGRKGGKEGVR